MKWIFRILGILILVLVVFTAGLLLLPGDKIAQVAVDQIRAQTGRDVILKGETTVSYYPVLGASTGALEIANADWSDAEPFMVADSLKIGVDLISLLRGEVKITGFEAVNPDLLLERAKDGRVNWDIGVAGVTPSGKPEGARNPLALSLDRALISGGRLRYLDHEKNRALLLEDLALDLHWPEYRGVVTFDLSGRLPDASLLKLSGEFEELAAFLEGAGTETRIDAETAGGTASYSGRIDFPLQLDGRLAVDLQDTRGALTGLGLSGVELPQGLGRKAAADANVTLSGDQLLALNGITLTLDQNRVTGDMLVDLAKPVPEVVANLSTGVFDLSGATGGNSGGGDAGGKGSAGWSTSPIDASALGLFNGKIALIAEGLRVGGLSFGASNTTATLNQSRAVIDLNRMAGYSGAVAGQVIANNRAGFSVGGSVKASGVEMQTLLTDLAGIKRFTGRADANVDFLGTGNSVSAIMNSLSGKGGVAMGSGTIKGFDLDSLMRQGLATGGTTVFDSLTATFTMDKGDLFNKDLLLKLPVISASGEGRVGIGARDIDYLFTPRTASAESTGGIAIPVRIRGPWSNPSIQPDLEKAIDLNLKEEKAAAKKKVEEKVKKELNIQTQEGQSLEDAAKKKLEDKVIKGLGKLLK